MKDTQITLCGPRAHHTAVSTAAQNTVGADNCERGRKQQEHGCSAWHEKNRPKPIHLRFRADTKFVGGFPPETDGLTRFKPVFRRQLCGTGDAIPEFRIHLHAITEKSAGL